MSNPDSGATTILLTNDDGIYADGLWSLYRALCNDYQVRVVAPDRERSAVGHGITLHNPLRVNQVNVNGGCQGWAVSGTPADCVKLAMLELLDRRPDMVISGINPGANVGVDLNYSGTVAAAKEGALYGVMSLAVSMTYSQTVHYETAADYIASLVPKLCEQPLPQGIFLNINVPNMPLNQISGARLSRQGTDLYKEVFEKRRDPRNRMYYWQGGESQPSYAYDDEDGRLLAANYISITPVRCNMTDFEALEKLKTWKFANNSSTPAESKKSVS
jgi:5'-nucleotidase